MDRSTDGTRREFLVRLARTTAFAVPVMSTFVLPTAAQAQGKGGDPCRKKRPPAWCLSRTAQIAEDGPTLDFEPLAGSADQVAPLGSPFVSAPWDRRPPGATP